MKTTLYTLLVAVSVTTLFSCKKESVNTPAAQETEISKNKYATSSRYTDRGCLVQSVELTAGQHINAGTIEVYNDDNFIYVTYNTANGYVLRETHLYVGNCEAVPVNRKGNPVPGQFPNKNAHADLTSFTYQVPVSAIGMGSCGCVAAHAAVVTLGSNGAVLDAQTAWGSGTLIGPDNGNWGMKFEYCTCSGGQ